MTPAGGNLTTNHSSEWGGSQSLGGATYSTTKSVALTNKNRMMEFMLPVVRGASGR
jgi:hypothetical protein